MANKRLGTAATELKLPTKKVKGEKKPKWQAKTVPEKQRGDAALAHFSMFFPKVRRSTC